MLFLIDYYFQPLFYIKTAPEQAPLCSTTKLFALAIFIFGIVLIPVSLASTISECVVKKR